MDPGDTNGAEETTSANMCREDAGWGRVVDLVSPTRRAGHQTRGLKLYLREALAFLWLASSVLAVSRGSWRFSRQPGTCGLGRSYTVATNLEKTLHDGGMVIFGARGLSVKPSAVGDECVG